jgi:separase
LEALKRRKSKLHNRKLSQIAILISYRESCLTQARARFENEYTGGKSSKADKRSLIAHASLLYSVLALEKGEVRQALSFARNSVRLLFHDWSRLESQKLGTGSSKVSSTSKGVSESQSEHSIADIESQGFHISISDGPTFWRLAYPLIRSVLRLSFVYAHLGMFQETLYYAEQAQKIASSTGASLYQAQATAWVASVWIKSNKAEKGLDLMEVAKQLMSSSYHASHTVALACQLSSMYGRLKNIEGEWSLAEEAMQAIVCSKKVTKASSGVDDAMAKQMKALSLKENTTRATRTTRARAPATAKKSTRQAKAKVKPVDIIPPPATVQDPNMAALRGLVLIRQALALSNKREWTEALALIEEARDLPRYSIGPLQDRIAAATCLIGQSMEQMVRDPVFSVVQESTISFPSIAAITSLDKTLLNEKAAIVKASPSRAGRGMTTATERKGPKERSGPEFIDTLLAAQEHLLEAHSVAAVAGDLGLVHKISALLQSTSILLSTTSSTVPRVLGVPAYAACSVELARNVAWRRERQALLSEKTLSKGTDMEWPAVLATQVPRRSSCGFTTDLGKFQKDYVDIIPQSWSVISMSLSDNRHDLCITKLQANQSPFVLRLPLERANSRDADNEIFNFEHGHAELLDIIKLANESCHDARDMSAKGAKSTWWAEREELDGRFKNLLECIESTWLGGFRGIFSQHQCRPDLLTKFQKSFQCILDKHLPSRRQIRGKRTKSPKITLDPRILELFIGLGDATIPDCDLDDPLNDLLYFIVDILQFHGERNAYDEIDFDSMVVDTFDALQAYYSAANNETVLPQNAAHSILVLDKSLHAFPWESLPCMHGLAASRVPSLSCLRRLILEAKGGGSTPQGRVQDGHTVSLQSGTYILNPSSDLTNTLATFEKPLSTLGPSWTGIVSRPPTEAEFEGALASSDIMLYFGHGSGAQYIRGRTIRKLEKCRSTVLLMGCSSASLADVGEFECHGPVWNYMLAGCPAAVGTLWDVTDRDIDRFAGRLFEEWGLMNRGTTVGRGQSKAKPSAVGRKGKKIMQDDSASSGDDGPDSRDGDACTSSSLVEAVAKARDACKFRYLTAAAVCVYGIPVYISNDQA